MRILGVHGILTDGSQNIDRMLFYMRDRYGYPVVDVQAEIRGPFSVRFASGPDAEALAKEAEDGDVVLAHSYGCLKTALAMEKVKFSHAFMFRPAMDPDYKFPQTETKVHCIHSRGDLAVMLGALLRFSHPFGSAGRKGFAAQHVINVQSKGGHNADFDRLEHWGAYIHSAIKAGSPRYNTAV